MATIDDSAPVCYLCLDGGADETGQPLRRDCACRGTDAGFVHLSCLVGFAETKSKQASGMNKFVNPWLFCTSCHQEYQNDLTHLECLAEYAAAKSKQASGMNKFVEPWQVCPGCHIKRSLELISRPSLYRSSEGNTPTIHDDGWRLFI